MRVDRAMLLFKERTVLCCACMLLFAMAGGQCAVLSGSAFVDSSFPTSVGTGGKLMKGTVDCVVSYELRCSYTELCFL